MKLALIGGGGVRTPLFTQSVAKYAQRLGITELSIMDIDQEKLHIYGSLAKYLASGDNPDLKVVFTTNFKEAVTGADYVVTTLRVGGDQGRIFDERIALCNGALGQETTGAGGFSFAIRTIPVMLEYCKIIKEVSNHAIIFNFTNPSGLVTQAMHINGYDNVIGICDGPTQLKSEIAGSLHISINDIAARIYGLNHLSWLDSARVNGVEILDKLISYDAFLENSKEFSHFDKDIIRMNHSIPSGYLYYYYYRERAVRNILSSPQTRGETVKAINDAMLKKLKDIDPVGNPEEALKAYHEFIDERESSYMSIEVGHKVRDKEEIDVSSFGVGEIAVLEKSEEIYEGYSGVAFNFIEAVKNNKPTEIPLNVPNNGAIGALEDGDVVEISCIVDNNGAKPMKIKNPDTDNLLLIKQVKRYEMLTVEAVMNRSKELALRALMVHPLIGSYDLSKKLVESYLFTFRDYLGEWK